MVEAAEGALEAAAAEMVTVQVAMEVAVEAAVMDPLSRANHNKVQLHLLCQHRTGAASIHRHHEHYSVKASRKHVKGESNRVGEFPYSPLPTLHKAGCEWFYRRLLCVTCCCTDESYTWYHGKAVQQDTR